MCAHVYCIWVAHSVGHREPSPAFLLGFGPREVSPASSDVLPRGLLQAGLRPRSWGKRREQGVVCWPDCGVQLGGSTLKAKLSYTRSRRPGGLAAQWGAGEPPQLTVGWWWVRPCKLIIHVRAPIQLLGTKRLSIKAFLGRAENRHQGPSRKSQEQTPSDLGLARKSWEWT